MYNKAVNFMYSANEGAPEHMLKNTAYVGQKTEKEAYLVTYKQTSDKIEPKQNTNIQDLETVYMYWN